MKISALFASALLLGGAASAHGFLDVMEEAIVEYERLHEHPPVENEAELKQYLENRQLFAMKAVNKHINADWEVEGVLDSYLNLVANCPLPESLCEDWAQGKYKTAQPFGLRTVSFRLLADATSHIDEPLPHRCAELGQTYLLGKILPTETGHMAVFTQTNAANSPCYLRKLN